ncbi:MAG TPA: MATE family efflux transporter [Bryobacteraceae bacterium]|nr:MATE family efflux transporter [Bryobacteraceae bacterium]
MLNLAAPLALAELGWMAMGVVDTVMAGRLGAAAVGAGSLGNIMFYPIAALGVGVLLSLDTYVAQAFGAKNLQECRHWLVNGTWLALGMSPVLGAAIWGTVPLLRMAGTNPHVMAQLVPFLKAFTWSLAPLLLFTAFRRYAQAVGIVKPVAFALVSANVVNLVGDWVLMYGHWGVRPMGLEGSGWSTTFARAYMAVVLLGSILWESLRTSNLLIDISWRPDFSQIRHLVKLGLPAGGQFAFEGAVFGVVAVLVARLDEASLAAHSIAVLVISATYMVPVGISSAAAVRVGHAIGRRDAEGASAAGWAALLLSVIFMGAAGLSFWMAPRAIMRIFIGDAAVVGIGAVLLRIAAFLELFDGVQVVATGALRGLGDTRTSMFAHFVGYWIIGLPVAYILCFPRGWGAAGIWIGLCAALIPIGSGLVLVWSSRSADLK